MRFAVLATALFVALTAATPTGLEEASRGLSTRADCVIEKAVLHLPG